MEHRSVARIPQYQHWESDPRPAKIEGVTSPDLEPDQDPSLAPGRVPVAQLVDLDSLGAPGRPPTPARIRQALPPGWVLEPGGDFARRDLRVLARDGWVLVLGLVCFGAAGLGLFWNTFPQGWRGVGRFAALVLIVLLIGGLVGPMITRALMRKPR